MLKSYMKIDFLFSTKIYKIDELVTLTTSFNSLIVKNVKSVCSLKL